jgi:hypothetical protein
MIKVFQLSIVCIATLALAAVCALVIVPTVPAASRWGVWAVVVVMVASVAASLTFLPALYRETSELGDFAPLGADGRPVSGTPQVQQLALGLAAQLAGSPYHVLTSPSAARVEWNTGDIRYQSLLLPHRVQVFYRATLFDVGRPGVISRVDALQKYNSSLGRMQTSSVGGRVWRYERRVDIAVTPEGLTKAVDYTLDTRVVDRAVRAACAAVGIRAGMDAQTKVGIIFAVTGGLVGVLMGVTFI